MAFLVPDALAWAASIEDLAAYFYCRLRRRRTMRFFDLSNVVGSPILALYAVERGAVPAAFLSAAWGLVGLVHLWRR